MTSSTKIICQKDESILESNQKIDKMFFILSGSCRVYKTKNDKKTELAILKE